LRTRKNSRASRRSLTRSCDFPLRRVVKTPNRDAVPYPPAANCKIQCREVNLPPLSLSRSNSARCLNRHSRGNPAARSAFTTPHCTNHQNFPSRW
jgi:hypothetical protein